MSTVNRVLLASLFVVICCGAAGPISAEEGYSDPDAIALLQKVEHVRSHTPAFRLKGSHLIKLANARDCKQQLDIAYAEGKFRIHATGDQPSVTIFDGVQFLCFDGKEIRVFASGYDVELQQRLGVFDPRIAGISWFMNSGRDLNSTLPLKSGFVTTLDGTDVIREAKVTKVSIGTGDVGRLQFWIDGSDASRVHRHVSVSDPQDGGFKRKMITESEFWPGAQGEWTPRKIRIVGLKNSDETNAFYEAIFQFGKPLRAPHFSPEMWTEKGLGLVVGQRVIDGRGEKKTASTWDGEKLVPESMPGTN